MFCKIRSLCVCLGLCVLMASHGATQGTLFEENFDQFSGRRPEGWRLWGELPPVGNYFRVIDGALYTGNGDDLILEDGYTFATVEGLEAQEWRDYTVEVDFRAIQFNGTILVVGRFENARNHYRAYFSISQSIEFGNERRAGIERVSDGERVVLGEVVNGRAGVVIPRIEGMRADNEWRRVAFAFQGDTISLRIDGQELLSVEDRTIRSGTAGVGQRFNAVYFDNFRVVAPFGAAIPTAAARDAIPGEEDAGDAAIEEYRIESTRFADVAAADALLTALEAEGIGPVAAQPEGDGAVVVVGPFADDGQAAAVLERLRQAGHAEMRLTSRPLLTITSDIQDIEAGGLERIIRANLAGLQDTDRGDAEELMRAIVAYMLKDNTERTSEEIDAIRSRLAELENQQEIIEQLNRSITEEKTRQERIDELVAEISDAIDRQNWDQAEQQLDRLRQLDPGNPHIDLKANALSLGRARITDLGVWINQAFASLENRVQTLDLRTVTDVQTELQAAEELRVQSQSDPNMLAQALVKYQSIQATADALLEKATTSADLRNALEYARGQAQMHIVPLRSDYRNLLTQEKRRQENLDKMADRQGAIWWIVLGLAGALVALVVALTLVILRQQKRHQQLLDLVNEIPARPVASIERTEQKHLDRGGAPKALEASAGLFGATGGQVGDIMPPEDEPMADDEDLDEEEVFNEDQSEPPSPSHAYAPPAEDEDEDKLIIGGFEDDDDEDMDLEETPTRVDEPAEAPLSMDDSDVDAVAISFEDESDEEEAEEEPARRPAPAVEETDDSDFGILDTDDMDFGLTLSDDERREVEAPDPRVARGASRAGESPEADSSVDLDATPLDLDDLGDMDFSLDDEPETPSRDAGTGKAAPQRPSALEETRPMDSLEDDDALGMDLDLDALTPLEDTTTLANEPAPEAARADAPQSAPEDDVDGDVDTLAMDMDGLDFDQELDLDDLSPVAPASGSGAKDSPRPRTAAPQKVSEAELDADMGIDLDGGDLLDFADLTPVFGDEDDEEETQSSDQKKAGGKGRSGTESLLEDITDAEADEPLDLSDILGDMPVAEEPPAPAQPAPRPKTDAPTEMEADVPSGFDLIDEKDDAEDSLDDPFAAISEEDSDGGDGLFDISDLGNADPSSSDEDEDRR